MPVKTVEFITGQRIYNLPHLCRTLKMPGGIQHARPPVKFRRIDNPQRGKFIASHFPRAFQQLPQGLNAVKNTGAIATGNPDAFRGNHQFIPFGGQFGIQQQPTRQSFPPKLHLLEECICRTCFRCQQIRRFRMQECQRHGTAGQFDFPGTGNQQILRHRHLAYPFIKNYSLFTIPAGFRRCQKIKRICRNFPIPGEAFPAEFRKNTEKYEKWTGLFPETGYYISAMAWLPSG